MKKVALIVTGIIFLAAGTLLASDLMVPVGKQSYVPVELPEHLKYNKAARLDRIPPEYEFVHDPTPLVTTYYDYMPGSYDGHPLKLQSANGGSYDGVYFVFHGQPGSTANNRRVYYGYVYPDGTVDYGLITSYDKWQGYPGVGIHPASGDPIASWHEDIFPESGNDCAVTYDDYDLMMIPGFWQDPMGIPQDPAPNREYIWPYIHVGPSPEPGYVRVYHISNNSEMDNACEHARLMYIDVPNDDYVYGDMAQILTLANWSDPIYIFRDWAEEYEIRPYSTFAVDWDEPGKVAFIGYAGYLMDEPTGNEPIDPGFYVWESYDYGETWDPANLHTYYPFMASQYVLYEIANVPGFTDDTGVPYPNLDVWVGWPGNQHSGHHSALYDGEGNLHMPILLWIVGPLDVVGGSASYWPAYLFHFQAEIVYMADGTWELRYVADLPGTDPWTGTPVPWTDPDTVYAWLDISTSNIDIAFHENIQHQAVNKDNDWMVQVWACGTELLKAENPEVDYPDPTDPNYLGHPIIYVAASNDNGATWSYPIELTDIYSDEFDFSDQITVYPYIAPQIIDLGDGWGQIYMYYFDDNDYGSYIQNQGPPTGGTITYMSIKIDFNTIVPHHPPSIGDEPEVVLPEFIVSNYPNPFANSTTISFTLPNNVRDAEVKIYNTRGQLVRTLTPSQASEPTQWEAVWDGRDMQGNSVASGIYFYKVETSLGTGSGKMLLMR